MTGNTVSQLMQLCISLEDYSPVVPEHLVQHVMKTAGYNCTDPIMLRYGG